MSDWWIDESLPIPIQEECELILIKKHSGLYRSENSYRAGIDFQVEEAEFDKSVVWQPNDQVFLDYFGTIQYIGRFESYDASVEISTKKITWNVRTFLPFSEIEDNRWNQQASPQQPFKWPANVLLGTQLSISSAEKLSAEVPPHLALPSTAPLSFS